MPREYRFIADAMLGRLAKWLRLLGFDTLYYPDISDVSLLKIARQEDRIILTRDTHFLRIKNLKDYLFINSNNTFEQLVEVIKALDINGAVLYSAVKEFNLSRCIKCNGILIDVKEKKDVGGLVPEHIYIQFNKFLRCQDCGNVYWEGTHMKRFRERILEILKRETP